MNKKSKKILIVVLTVFVIIASNYLFGMFLTDMNRMIYECPVTTESDLEIAVQLIKNDKATIFIDGILVSDKNTKIPDLETAWYVSVDGTRVDIQTHESESDIESRENSTRFVRNFGILVCIIFDLFIVFAMFTEYKKTNKETSIGG